MKHKKETLSFKHNSEIKDKEVRVVSEENSPVLRTSEALRMAESRGEDLVLINDKVSPPIAKIIDYNKYVYQQRKAAAERKANTQKVIMKEVRFSVNIDTNDLNVKTERVKKFIQEGNKVKCTMLLKGRQNINPDRGQVVLLNLAQMLEGLAVPETMPKLDGKKWLMIFKPKK